MIQIKFKELFGLEILHSFYLSGKCADFEIVPTANCRVLLLQTGVRFLPVTYGCKLFAKVNVQDDKDIFKNPLPDGTKFSFIIKLKKNTFENFTSLNLKKPKTSHYYFNNLVDNISGSGAPLLVADTAGKIVSDADLLPFVNGSFSFVHNSTKATQAGELKFTDSGEKFSQKLDNNNNVFNFTFDLEKTAGGRADFSIEGAKKSSVFVIDPKDNAAVFAVVEIFYKKSLNDAYQFQLADNSIETKSYKIAFGNRFTKWRYIVTKKFNQAVTGINVSKTNGTTIEFVPEASEVSGQFIAVSKNPMPLKEEPVTGIKLSDQAGTTVIIPNLPNPSLTMIKPAKDSTDIFSDILITI